MKQLTEIQGSILASDKGAESKPSSFQAALRSAQERTSELERANKDLREQVQERDREIERLRHEVRLLRSKTNVSLDQNQETSDRVCELEQESIVLACKYRSACRRNEILEKRLRMLMGKQENLGVVEHREGGDRSAGLWKAPCEEAEEKAVVTALGSLNIEDCRRPCAQTSIERYIPSCLIRLTAMQPNKGVGDVDQGRLGACRV